MVWICLSRLRLVDIIGFQMFHSLHLFIEKSSIELFTLYFIKLQQYVHVRKKFALQAFISIYRLYTIVMDTSKSFSFNYW